MSLNSLLYANPLNLNCATLNVTGVASGNVKVAPIITSSSVFIPNMYVNRSKYCDNANVGNVAGAVITGSTITANSNNVIARGLWDTSGASSVSTYAGAAPTTGQVLTATSATTATWQSPGGSAVLQNATVTLNAAALANLQTVPITVVPAPGVGKIVIPLSTYSQYVYSTTPYTGNAELGLYYTGTFVEIGGTPIYPDQYNSITNLNYLAILSGGSPFTGTDLTNTALQLQNTSLYPILGGGGTVQLDVQYMTIAL